MMSSSARYCKRILRRSSSPLIERVHECYKPSNKELIKEYYKRIILYQKIAVDASSIFGKF